MRKPEDFQRLIEAKFRERLYEGQTPGDYIRTALALQNEVISEYLAEVEQERVSRQLVGVGCLRRMSMLTGKFWRGVILTPIWPLIWLELGFDLRYDGPSDLCGGCCQRAEAMVRWWRGPGQDNSAFTAAPEQLN